MKKFITIVMVLLFSVTALAEKKKQNRKTQEVTFDGSDVDGQVRTPDGAYLHQKKGTKFLPVYKIEKRFDRDIKESVDYLR